MDQTRAEDIGSPSDQTAARGGECHGNWEFGRFLLAAKTYSLQDLRNEGQKI